MKIEQTAAEHLQKWLTTALQKVCDADPGALARYVMALLRKDKPEDELKAFCVDQLDVFLQKETVAFVDRLFEVIKDQSYLPADAKEDLTNAASGNTPQNQASGDANNEANRRPSSDSGKRQRKDEHERDDRDARRRDSEKERPKEKDKVISTGSRHAPKHVIKPDVEEAPPQKAARKRISPPPPPAPAPPKVDPPPTGSPGRRYARDRDRRPDSRERERSARLRRDRERADRERDRRRAEPPSRRRDQSPVRTVVPPPQQQPVDRNRDRDRPAKVDRSRSRSRSPKPRDKPQPAPARTGVANERERAGGSTREVVLARRDPLSGLVRRAPAAVDSPPSAHSSADRSDQSDEDDTDRSATPPPYAPTAPRPPAGREKCADYEEKGYCMRGDNCPYDHGPDPVVVEDPGCLRSMMPISTAPPVITMPNLSVPPPGFVAPPNPPVPGLEPSANGYGVTRPPPPVSDGLAYNPEQPSLSVGGSGPAPFSVPPPGHASAPSAGGAQQSAVPWPGYAPPPPVMPPPYPPTTVRLVGEKRQLLHGADFVPWHAKRGRGGGLTTRLGPVRMAGPAGESYVPNNTTLEVRKIPVQMNNITKLNEHFGKFGPITNIQVGFDGDGEAALVTYAVRVDAVKAYKSTEPILNNRFVKVFWHNPAALHQQQQHQQPGEPLGRRPANADNPPIVQATVTGSVSKTFYNPAAMKMYRTQRKPPAAEVGDAPTVMPASATGPPTAFAASGAEVAAAEARDAFIAARRRLKENRDRKQQYVQLRQKKVALMNTALEQQKMLVARMHKCTDAQRKQYIQMFETMTDKIKQYKSEIDDITKKIQGLDRKHSSSGGGVAAAAAAAQNAERAAKVAGVQAEMKQLQAQLQQQKESGTDVTQVMQRIAVLKSELTALASASLESRQRRTSFNKRTGRTTTAPPASANLDRRPKKLFVTGFDDNQRDTLLQTAQRYARVAGYTFDATADGDPKFVVEFSTRREAEQVRELLPDCIEGRTLAVEWAPSPIKGTLSKSNSFSASSEKQADGVKAEVTDDGVHAKNDSTTANVKQEDADTSGELAAQSDENGQAEDDQDEEDLLGPDDSSDVASRRSNASRQMSATEMLDALGEDNDSDENRSEGSDDDSAFRNL